MSDSVPKKETFEQIIRAKIQEMEKFSGLTITDSLGVDITEGLIHYMKLGIKERLQQFVRTHDCSTTSFCCATELLKELK